MIRIFLTGYMGSGKTTLGRALAIEIGIPFIDLDHYIEKRHCKTIAQLFAEKGEEGFREIERRILHEVGEKFKYIVTLEDGTVKGGLGRAVVEYMAANGYTPKVKVMGIPDAFVEHGTPEQLYKVCRMDKESVLATIMEFKNL